jgi:hypothetical protein
LVQVPPQQVLESPVQVFPQVPQLPLLVEVFTQVLLQRVPPVRKQPFANPGLNPLFPKENVGVVVVAVVAGTVVVTVGTFVHVDALQTIPDGHMFPQIPQLDTLDERS